jgi:hypothetical protein
MSVMSEADILVTQLAEEIAEAIGGTPDLYRNAASTIVLAIPEFNFLGNWAIEVTAPGYACKVTTDAGTTVVISPVFDQEDAIQYDDECRVCEDVAVGNTGYCMEHTPAATDSRPLVCCRHCGDPTGSDIPICDSCDERMSRL